MTGAPGALCVHTVVPPHKLIWRDDNLPASAPPFAASLTDNLFYHGYRVLSQR